ncbi:MAG: prepilin-type N-terminal cleavage/methylation domain-containing protein [SAR324 cluster bacterium]|nr:prepilin-type N-terminal cleavage/methylation domain-containing protein [SAR324 cluster bacterium]
MKPRLLKSIQAFTLLELLITLALFAALTTMLLGGFFQFQKGQEFLEDSGDLKRKLWVIEKLLSEDLKNATFDANFAKALPEGLPRQSGIVGKDNPTSGGDLDEIHLHVRAPSKFFRGLTRNQDPGLHEVSWYVQEQDSVNHLIRREEFYLDDDIEGGPRSQGYSLASGIVSFDIKYYPKNGDAPSDSWTSNSTNTLPIAVIVTIELKDKKGAAVKIHFTKNLRPNMGAATWAN